MTSPNHRDPESQLARMHRLVRGMCLAAFGMVIAIWVAVPVLLPGPRESDMDGRILALIFYAVGLADVALGWWMKNLALSPGRHVRAGSREEVVGGVAGLSMVAVAMAATPAVLGVAHFAIFGDRGALNVLCVLSLAALALSWPSLDRWQEVLRVTRIDEDHPG
ncbi:MAG: hypothetical protein RDU83_07130 [bacterium]|nr:hypothetical protein [bacterium]